MDPLLELARSVRSNAYAPYSEYLVGAAVEDERGRLYSGANVENISFGLTICAERSAITAMVSAGGRKIVRLALVTKDSGTPCGACLQVISEFSQSDTVVHIGDEKGNLSTLTMGELLPHAFSTRL